MRKLLVPEEVRNHPCSGATMDPRTATVKMNQATITLTNVTLTIAAMKWRRIRRKALVDGAHCPAVVYKLGNKFVLEKSLDNSLQKKKRKKEQLFIRYII